MPVFSSGGCCEVSRKQPGSGKHQPRGLTILHEDRDVIVVSKDSGLLTIGTDRGHERTAHAALMDYVRKGNPKSRERVFVVHRLDRETSGVLVFARSEKAKSTLQKGWQEVEKVYLAAVVGIPEPREGTISTYLVENAAMRVYSSSRPGEGRFSETQYQVVKTRGDRALPEVTHLTGRKHQIRVHLSERGWPIVGDPKYGTKTPNHERLALHSHRLGFDHPYHGGRISVTAPLPHNFRW